MRYLLSLGHVKAYRSLPNWYIFLPIVFFDKPTTKSLQAILAVIVNIFIQKGPLLVLASLRFFLGTIGTFYYRYKSTPDGSFEHRVLPFIPRLLQLHTALLCEHPTSREILIKIPSEILPTQKGKCGILANRWDGGLHRHV